MPKFVALEKKVDEKKKKLDSLKSEASKDPDVKKKYDAVVLALAKCVTEVADGKKAEDLFNKASKDFDVAYQGYKKAKDELKSALGKSKLKLNISLKDLEFAADFVKAVGDIFSFIK
jgi:hypothetical protein